MKNKLLFLFFLLGLPGGLFAQKVIYVDTLLPEAYTLKSISVVDSSVVWAVGSSFWYTKGSKEHFIKVIRTVDGGRSWRVFNVQGSQGSQGHDIVGFSEDEAWITTSSRQRNIFRTTDGGATWQHTLKDAPFAVILKSFDQQHVLSQDSGGVIGRSSNGGVSWSVDTIKTYQKSERTNLRLAANNAGAIVGDTFWIGTTQGRILRCTNYGADCFLIKPVVSTDTVIDIYSFAFSSPMNGLMKYDNGTDDLMACTTDGGFTWQILEDQPNEVSAYILEPILGYPNAYVAYNPLFLLGHIHTTMDAGQSWTTTVVPGVINSIESQSNGQLWIAVRRNPQKHLVSSMADKVSRLQEFKMDSAAFINIFYTIERTNMLSLWQAQRESEALHHGNIPEQVKASERKIRDSIACLEKTYFELSNKPVKENDAVLKDLTAGIEHLRNKYDSLLLQLQVKYPDYRRRLNDWQIGNVEEYQRELLYSDQALIHYLIADSVLFVTCVQQNKFFYRTIEKDFPLEQWITDLRSTLTAFQTDPAMANSYDSLAPVYTSVAYRLYQKLLAPIADSLPEHLIIVPDGALHYLPFEVLLTAAPAAAPSRWPEHPYLLKKHSISYTYSGTMLREMTVHPHLHEPKVNFYGFAPRYEGGTALLDSLFPGTDLRKDLQPLPYTGEEVYRAAKLMDGAYFTGSEASEANFRAKASEARILHLATHGRANSKTGDYSFLVFAEQKDGLENEILYARDIYNLQLNADLVTLSACETGLGELQENEGVISLARAFAYAGAKSIVTSLWSVSDAKTKDLMVDFYKNLRKGMLKDDALRQAKLDFLKRNRGQAAHPFYWAGFVGIGNMGKVK